MSRRNIHLSPNLSLPLEVVTESIAVLAVRRAGKSNLAKVLFEELFGADQQVGAIDPKGDWWGVRSSADGKHPGLPVLIIGGEHGDVPLEPSSGELVAQLVVRERVSFVLDLSALSKRKVAVFMADFLETLYRMKAQDAYRTTMMLIVDEADAIAPQHPQKGEERMLGAAEDIVRRGGQRGLGIALVSQRAAVLNKNVLTQCGVLFLLRTTGSQDIDAVDHWIKKHGQADKRSEVMDTIAALPRGSAWVWAPGWPNERGIFKLVDINLCSTFDSGQTPKPGEKRKMPKTVADVDLDAFRTAMAATIEKAKADDPGTLRATIAELQREVAARKTLAPAPPVSTKEPKSRREDVATIKQLRRALEAAMKIIVQIKAVDLEKAGIDHEQVVKALNAGVELAARKIEEHLEGHARSFRQLKRMTDAAAKDIEALLSEKLRFDIHVAHDEKPQATQIIQRESVRRPRPPAPSDGEAQPLKKGARTMLAALASMYPKPLTRMQVATLSCLAPNSGTYANYLGAIRAAGFVDDDSAGMTLTDAGRAYVAAGGPLPSPPTTEELVVIWSSKLKAGARRMLDVLVAAYPTPITRDELAHRSAIEPKSGTFANYLGALRGNALAEDVTGGIRAGEALFLGGR